MLEGSCHCGGVHVRVTHAPPDVAECNCSVCRRLGELWSYYKPAEVEVVGDTDTYVWGDRCLALHRCKTCGCVTHWSPLIEIDRMGVNMRNFEPAIIKDLPVRKVDNA
ncbi:MAG TPA: GFA family protein [Caulobacteraceae bacterium]|nr:GFA family protein [Caulobacteraceae bacterium]